MTIEELGEKKMSDIVTSERFAKHLKEEWQNKTKYPLRFRVKIRGIYGADLLEKMPYEFMAILDKKSKLSATERFYVSCYCESAFKKTMKELLDEVKKESPMGKN